MSKLSKYVKKNGIIVKTFTYAKICKIKYNLSSWSKSMHLYLSCKLCY